MSKIAFIVVGIILVACAVWFGKARKAAFPYFYNPGNHAVSEEDVGQIKQLIRDRGEQYLISINVVSANNAGATTGHGSFRPKSGRKYSFVRGEKGWSIEKVEEWKN